MGIQQVVRLSEYTSHEKYARILYFDNSDIATALIQKYENRNREKFLVFPDKSHATTCFGIMFHKAQTPSINSLLESRSRQDYLT